MDYHSEKTSSGYAKEDGVNGYDDASLREVNPDAEYEEPNNLKRQLKNRHIAMISYVFFSFLLQFSD